MQQTKSSLLHNQIVREELNSLHGELKDVKFKDVGYTQKFFYFEEEYKKHDNATSMWLAENRITYFGPETTVQIKQGASNASHHVR